MKSIKLASLATVGMILTSSVYAQNYLLTVDVSNPSAVVITATGNNASVADSISDFYGGVDLLSFFTSAFPNVNSVLGSPSSGTLIGASNSAGYNYFDVDNYSGSFVDLNPFAFYGFGPGSDPTQLFTTTDPAFTGSITLDMSAYTSELPNAGASGDIRPGAQSGSNGNRQVGSIIGQWQVISTTPTPEPSTLALASLGGVRALFFAWRRRK